MKATKPVSFEDTSVAFSSKSNYRLFKMYLLFGGMHFNKLVKIANNLISFFFKINFPVKPLIKYTVFEHFCGGETILESEKTIRELAKFNIGAILDYSVEGEKTEQGFDKTAEEIIRTINKSRDSDDIPFCVFKPTGVAPADLLTKIQSGAKLTEQECQSFQMVKTRVENICHEAHRCNTRILIDGEESWMQDTIDELAYEMMVKFNREKVVVYNTFQMYRTDMLDNLKSAFSMVIDRGSLLGAKLVRGAYMEKERDRAAEMGYVSPIQPDKASSDRDFNLALKFCVDNYDAIGLCSGTHNEYSNLYLTQLMEEKKIDPADPIIFFAQLYGMSDNISFNLSKSGYNVVKYVPYGPVQAVLPYLFRRSQENSSVAGQSSREFAYIKREIKRRLGMSRSTQPG
ncbi:proline dehydrogenase family protein [Fulvivirgaceae bacterium BMA12]|uniref:Proline dehydrogenase family protein n=1 Tax=Agaribacillus aureus TaxID=3051825 RepID=A0ABT8L5Z6_9BACT|nr:proline dehydrogenase family protein [Fulvivirgaceae bacterium BMA12]